MISMSMHYSSGVFLHQSDIFVITAQQRQGNNVFVQKTNPNPRPIVSYI